MAADFTRLHNQRHPQPNKHDSEHSSDPPFATTHGFTQWQRDIGGIDPILTALNQLGALKTGCTRAFTAIFEGDTPRIMAEATAQSSALGQERQDEAESFINSGTLGLRSHSGSGSGDSVFDGHRVILDTRLEPPGIQEHQLLQHSLARFYAEIPLRDPSGNLVGTYGVLDHNDHPSFGSDDLATLYSVAGSIATHLDNAAARQKNAHTRRRLNALFEIAEGSNTPESRKRSSTSGSDSLLSTIPEAHPVHPHIASVYAKASSVLQAGMQADGVMFMNAPRINCINSSRSSRTGSSDSGVSVGPADTIRRSSQGVCDSMASAFSKRYTANGYTKPSGTIDEELLHKLLKGFPQGKIFNLIQGVKAAEPIPDADTMTSGLLDIFPDISSLIFLPIWKCDKPKCLAAMIVWTCEPFRTFKDDDLYYLKAAGNLIVLEITQADHSALEKSDFDPLASMSHELRSPLHGVLANAELLQSTNLDPAQRDMVTTVETCGEMLLESLNDFIGPGKLAQPSKSPTRSQPIRIPDPIISPMSVMPSWDGTLSKISNATDGRAPQSVVRSTVCDDEALSPKGQRSSGALHVLVVDDNNINLKVLSTFLQKTGCTFETASDGLSALQIYQETTRNFDYVLMDISMPVMDGITASKKIREFEEKNKLRRSTIMAVTSITCREKQEQAFAAGINDYLVKPLSLRDLRVILR